MIGILLASHGNLCRETLASAEMIVGKQEGVEVIALDETGIDVFSEKLKLKLEKCISTYEETIMLTDITNATPYNCCYRFAMEHPEAKLPLISGFNLPIVIELFMMRQMEKKGDVLAKHVLDVGKSSVELKIWEEELNEEKQEI